MSTNTKLLDPIETKFYNICQIINPYLRKIGFTPNLITTAANVFVLLSIKNYKYGLNNKAALFFLISALLDCCDGDMARTYNMGSKFGMYYDFVSDIVINGIYMYIIFKNLYAKKMNKHIFFFFILLILCAVDSGCKSIYKNKNVKNDGPLHILKKLCPIKINNKENLKKIINYTKFFGYGAIILYITYLIKIS